jgi:hypothetical protein
MEESKIFRIYAPAYAWGILFKLNGLQPSVLRARVRVGLTR